MQLTYQKLGQDHPMFGKVEFLVADGTTPICYKTKEGYLPLLLPAEQEQVSSLSPIHVESRPLYVLSFKVNGEYEEMTFTSKKKLEKYRAGLAEKSFITDIDVVVYQVLP